MTSDHKKNKMCEFTNVGKHIKMIYLAITARNQTIIGPLRWRWRRRWCSSHSIITTFALKQHHPTHISFTKYFLNNKNKFLKKNPQCSTKSQRSSWHLMIPMTDSYLRSFRIPISHCLIFKYFLHYLKYANNLHLKHSQMTFIISRLRN